MAIFWLLVFKIHVWVDTPATAHIFSLASHRRAVHDSPPWYFLFTLILLARLRKEAASSQSTSIARK